MAIIATYKIGNVTAYIDDEYCKDKTEEDTNTALRNIANIYKREYLAGRVRELTDEERAEINAPSKAIRIK